jgi:hypothetical protein
LVNLITKAKAFTTISTPIVARIPNEMFRWEIFLKILDENNFVL